MGLFCWSVSVMLIPTKDRVAITKLLFEEGVMVAKKDYNAAKHPHVPCRNLYVIKLMQSFKSRGLVTETFSWQWYSPYPEAPKDHPHWWCRPPSRRAWWRQIRCSPW